MFAVSTLILHYELRKASRKIFINSLNPPYSVNFGEITLHTCVHMIYGDNWLLLRYSATLTLMFRPLIQLSHPAENKL